MEFNRKLKDVDFSGISNIVKRANALGGDLIRLEIGDVDFSPPTSILEGINAAFTENKTHYPAFQGDPDLINTIVTWLYETNNILVKPEQVLITAGGSMALYLSLQTILNNGDEVLLPIPVWPHLHEMIILAGGIPKPIPSISTNGFHLDFDLLAKSINAKTKAIVINTPNNPTGTVYSKDEITELAKLASKHDLTIISDEEYESFCFQDSSITSPIQYYSKVIICRSFSKMLSISGLRLGFLIAPAEWIPIISKWNLYSSMYNSSIVQRSVSHALVNSKPFVTNLVDTYKKRMQRVSAYLNNIEGVKCNLSEGAIYVWPDFGQITKDDVMLANYFLEKAKVVTVPGSVFGINGKGYLRISLACNDENIERALSRINEATLQLNKNDVK